jgi:hypothetical protein
VLGLAISDPSLAEPILIVEIHNFDDCYDCAIAGTFFGFDLLRIATPTTPELQAEWSVFAAPADLGRTFAMPSELIPNFNPILTHPETIFGTLSLFGDASHNFVSPPKLNQTNTGGDFITVTRVAPNLGANLFGYKVTGITQTIDDLTFTQIGSNLYSGTAAHTVHIYGEPVPEPATFLVAVSIFISLFVMGTRHHSKAGSNRFLNLTV